MNDGMTGSGDQLESIADSEGAEVAHFIHDGTY